MKKIGVIPAAGYARRLGKINRSKEMIQVKGENGMEPVCHSLLRQFETAGIEDIALITRKDKIDLIDHFENNLSINAKIYTILLHKTNSTLESICSAYDVIQGKEVYLGFPDMIMFPVDAMKSLSQEKERSSADVVLGAILAKVATNVDMIDFDTNDRLKDLVVKGTNCGYEYTWIIACWGNNFTEYLCNSFHSENSGNNKEIYIGNIFQAYSKTGNSIEVHRIKAGEYIDIGDPEFITNPQ